MLEVYAPACAPEATLPPPLPSRLRLSTHCCSNFASDQGLHILIYNPLPHIRFVLMALAEDFATNRACGGTRLDGVELAFMF